VGERPERGAGLSHRLTDVVAPALARLMDDADLVGSNRRLFETIFRLLTKESLQLPAAGPLPRFSGICNDGTPFQFCITLSPDRPGVRYLTEVGQPGMDLTARVTVTRRRLETVCEVLGCGSRLPSFDPLARLLPNGDLESIGGLWVGAGADPAGIRLRLYANCGFGTEFERWRRVARCLTELDAEPFRALLRPMAPTLVPNFTPSGFALTIPGEPRTLKLYLRPRGIEWDAVSRVLARVGGDEAGAMLAAIERALWHPIEALPPHALILSLAHSDGSGSLDAKLDLCGHCLFTAGADAATTVVRLARRLELDPGPYARARKHIEIDAKELEPSEHAFVGVGYHPDRGYRLNVYLRPPIGRRRLRRKPMRSAPTPEAVRAKATADAVRHLLRVAEAEGRWSDYHLPVGPSTTWVTAYVANALEDARGAFAGALELDAERAHALVVDHLTAASPSRSGWAYNDKTEPDADSTALALLYLRRRGAPTADPRASLDVYQNPDGGFGTFATCDSWGNSHADVTPTAIRASSSAPLTSSDLPSILGARENGYWRSFWWRTDLYATEANLRLLADAGAYEETVVSRPYLLNVTPVENAFETALRVRALASLPSDPEVLSALAEALAFLLEMQERDGGFPPGAWLRLTYPMCARPWEAPDTSGPLYLDDGIMTTATALSALVRTLPASSEERTS
jgi:hypothetical protein